MESSPLYWVSTDGRIRSFNLRQRLLLSNDDVKEIRSLIGTISYIEIINHGETETFTITRMRNELQKFHETVGILVAAYMNETLVHGHPCGCAVGNLIATKLNVCVILSGDRYLSDNRRVPEWDGSESGFSWFKVLYPERVKDGDASEGIEHIRETGYSIEQILDMEKAFESVVECFGPNGRGTNYSKDKDGYLGLMAVVDVLADIHGIDLSIKEEAKLLFIRP